MAIRAALAVSVAALSALACLSPAVRAADMPVKAPPPASNQPSDQPWQVTLNSEVQYYSWSSSQGYPTLPLQVPADPRGPGKGSQVYIPYAMQVDGALSNDLQAQFLVRSGYVSSRQTTAGISASAETPTDTTFGTTLTYNGVAGLQPFVSANVNAPTGKTVLLGNTALARPDPYLAGVPTFGEGWNIGPTLGFNVPITTDLVASLSGGFTSRGSYNREGVIPLFGMQGITSINPGDDTTVNSSIAYQKNALALQFSAAYTWETQTTIGGAPVYKTGNAVTLTGNAGYAWNAAWSSQLLASFTHTDRNLAQNLVQPPVFLVSEAANSNSDITQLSLSTTYTQGPFAIGPTAKYIYRNHNDWDPTSSQFLPAETFWAAGAMAQYNITQKTTLTARVERRWVYEDVNPDKLTGIGILAGSGFPAISSNGWMASLGGTVKF
jgi:hypothetical protein